MNTSYEKLSDVTGRITIKVEEADYASQYNKLLKDYAKQPMKGFRPGAAPKQLIEKKFGKNAKYEALSKIVSDALVECVKENKLDVIGQPIPETRDLNLDDKDFTYEFLVGLYPVIEVEQKVNKDLHVPYYNIEVTDEMIDRQDTQLRRQFGEQVSGDEVNEDALVKGVITELDANGQPMENGIVQENGIVAPKYFQNKEQAQLFMGKHPMDEVLFNPFKAADGNATELSSMLGIDKEDVPNHQGDFLFSIRDIIVLKPAELGQEYYDRVFGKDHVKDEKEYREALKAMIQRQLVGDSNYRFSIDAEEAVRKAIGDVVLPDEVIKDFLKNQNESLNDDNIEEEYAKGRGQIEWEIITRALATAFDVKVDDEDVRNIANMVARQQLAQYGMTNLPDEAFKTFVDRMLKDQNTLNNLANNAMQNKLFATIREHVTVDEKTVSVDEFNALFKQPEAE